jgi:hypothetical protein
MGTQKGNRNGDTARAAAAQRSQQGMGGVEWRCRQTRKKTVEATEKRNADTHELQAQTKAEKKNQENRVGKTRPSSAARGALADFIAAYRGSWRMKPDGMQTRQPPAATRLACHLASQTGFFFFFFFF